MEGLDAFEILKIISTCVSIILGCITLGGVLVKSLRHAINKFTTDINDNITKSHNELKNDIKNVKEDLSDKIFKNEKDRLKSELFDCGNRCRRKMPLYLEEFRHIQDVYAKYHNELHANGTGKEEYDFISEYFNSQFNQDLIK